MQGLKQSFGIDDTFTKLYRRPIRADEMTKVKDQIPLIEGYNEMIDVLHLPTDKFGYNKLLVVVDIATDAFDIEKMKGETGDESLVAFNRILKRGIVKFPYASILTDGGSSFKGNFHKFLYERGVHHKVARPGRHHQLSNVDNLCRQLGDIFNGIMNKKEAEELKANALPHEVWKKVPPVCDPEAIVKLEQKTATQKAIIDMSEEHKSKQSFPSIIWFILIGLIPTIIGVIRRKMGKIDKNG
jgi:hypothetical protein